MESSNISNKQKGFTLIELLVVIAIIGLLASIVMVSVSAARVRGRDGKRIGDLNQFAKALELFFDDYKGFPTSVAGGVALTTTNVPGIVPKYLSQMPQAPTPQDGSCLPAENTYTYFGSSYSGNGYSNAYTVTFCLGAGISSGMTAGPHSLVGGAFR